MNGWESGGRSLLGLLICGLTVRAGSPPIDEAWALTGSYLFVEAAEAFAAMPGAEPEARLGWAVASFSAAAANPVRAREVRATLAALVDVPGEVGIAARFHLARLRESHDYPPDPAGAAAGYRALYRDFPAAPLAQWGMVRVVLAELYRVPPAELPATWARAEALASELRDPAVRASLHLQLGQAADRLEAGVAVAHRHYAEAEALGIARAPARATTWLRLAELATALGRRDEAMAWFKRFLADFPRDPRVLTVERRVAEEEAAR